MEKLQFIQEFPLSGYYSHELEDCSSKWLDNQPDDVEIVIEVLETYAFQEAPTDMLRSVLADLILDRFDRWFGRQQQSKVARVLEFAIQSFKDGKTLLIDVGLAIHFSTEKNDPILVAIAGLHNEDCSPQILDLKQKFTDLLIQAMEPTIPRIASWLGK